MRLGVAAAVVDGALVRGDVSVEDGVVAAVGQGGSGHGIACPGLVDLQVNGYAGVDVASADAASLATMAEALARDGVLWFQPTVVSGPGERMRESLGAIGDAMEGGVEAILGAHLEGPFLARGQAGAHEAGALRSPSLDRLASFLSAGCRVSMVTLAPELQGADEVIEALVESGTVVSLGHTQASAVAAQAAFDHGASAVTHLYNAMRPLHHRDPGVVGVALTRDDVVVQLIGDGEHVAAEAMLLAWRAARGRIVLVSDAIAAAGRGDGWFRLGEVDVHVEDGVARTRDGSLAGATRPLVRGVRLLAELGVPIPEAVDAVTRTPARLLSRDDVGRLAPGARADLVVLDDGLCVERVYRGGVAIS